MGRGSRFTWRCSRGIEDGLCPLACVALEPDRNAELPTLQGFFLQLVPEVRLNSYPGLAKACTAYGMSEAELRAHLPEHNPVDRLAPLARARVPIYHIHGDADTVVPLEENSGELARRYRALGGTITLNVIAGKGHDLWPGWFQCEELVDFVLVHARRAAVHQTEPPPGPGASFR